jgi:hypothetical protein
MRCDEVVRELSAPTADRDRAAMAEHLAGCSACAEWARRVQGLDRLWDATRPAEPSPEAWDAVWANIAQALPGAVVVHRAGEDSPAPDFSPSRNGSGPKLLMHPAPAPAPAPAGSRPRGRSWRLTAVVLVGLAQAAAILVALGLAWQPFGHRNGPPEAGPPTDSIAPGVPSPIRVASPVKVDLDVQAGHLMVIHAKGQIEDATPPEMNTSSDPGLAILNTMESITTPQVAAR